MICTICTNRLIGVSGLIFAVVDDNVTVEEAIANKGQTVSFGNNFKKNSDLSSN